MSVNFFMREWINRVVLWWHSIFSGNCKTSSLTSIVSIVFFGRCPTNGWVFFGFFFGSCPSNGKVFFGLCWQEVCYFSRTLPCSQWIITAHTNLLLSCTIGHYGKGNRSRLTL